MQVRERDSEVERGKYLYREQADIAIKLDFKCLKYIHQNSTCPLYKYKDGDDIGAQAFKHYKDTANGFFASFNHRVKSPSQAVSL